MDLSSLQFREKWLRITFTIPCGVSGALRALKELDNFKNFLSDQVMPNWDGLIGWYGWRQEDWLNDRQAWETTYSMILRFSAAAMQGKSAKDVFEKAREQFHRSGKLTTNVYGYASVEMVPRPRDIPVEVAFGILPLELSCFYPAKVL